MTNRNHYQKEEQPIDTPETMLANWNATTGALDGKALQAAQALNRSDELLNYIEAIVPDDDKPYVQESKAIAQQMAEEITRFDLARIQADAFMKEMLNRHHRLAGDYEELQNDIADVNRDNPLVDRLVTEVEEETADAYWNDPVDVDYQEALGEAYDNVFQEIHDGISDVTGSHDWRAIYNLTDLLVGNINPSEQQKQLLEALLDTCREPEAADATP